MSKKSSKFARIFKGIMFFYFLLIRIAALFGHRKARLLVAGQKAIRMDGDKVTVNGKELPQNAIWIHVSSVGEFEQARPLIEKLSGKRKIILTFFSPSGYELRKNYDKVDGVCYLPFATRRNARRFIESLQPQMAIFVKYEFWPAYLRELKKRNIPTYSISAIFREKQLFFRPWGGWYRRLLTSFTRIYVQDEASKTLLEKYGITKVSISGDTRFDRVHDVMQTAQTRNAARLAPVHEFTENCERVIVAGSSWPKDEELLVRYVNEHPDVKLILVPHEIDPKHLHFIFNLLEGRFVRYSALEQQSSPVIRRSLMQHVNVLLIDTIGLLSSIYRFGQVAYIGGGFGVGIHNTIEAAVYGVPVIFGPNYLHFREAKGLIAEGAAFSIHSYTELESALNNALEHHREIGAKSASYVESEIGATEKIYSELFGHS
jgi:3-deoxy-D-manno-octulosonic-acid transferase